MNLQELLQLLGAKEVDLYVAKKRIAELETQLKTLHEQYEELEKSQQTK